MALFMLPRANETAGSSEAEYCTKPYKYTAKGGLDEQNDDDEFYNSGISSKNQNDDSKIGQDLYPFSPQGDGLVAFSADEEPNWEGIEGQSWDNITSKFSDAREERSKRPPLILNDVGFILADSTL